MTGPNPRPPTTPDPPIPKPPQRPAATHPSPQIPDPSPGEPRPPVGPSRFSYLLEIPNPYAHRQPVATAVLGLYGWSVVFREPADRLGRARSGRLQQRIHATEAEAMEHLQALAERRAA